MSDIQSYFREVLPRIYTAAGRDYAPREEQIAYAEQVHSAMNYAHQHQGEKDQSCAVLPIGAETGIGKTLGFLIPMLDRVALDRLAGLGHRAAFATFTLQLRDQIIQKDLPTAIEAISIHRGVQLTYASYHSSASYLSYAAIRDILRHPKASPQDLARAKIILDHLGDPEDADCTLIDQARSLLSVEDHLPIFDSVPDRSLGCTWKEAQSLKAYTDMRSLVRSADLILTSHAAMLYNVKGWYSMLDGLDDQHWIRYAAFDEAHRLPDAAQSMMRNSLSLFNVAKTIHEANTIFGPVHGVEEMAADLHATATTLKEVFPEPSPKEDENHLINLSANDTVPTLGQTVRTVLMERIDWKSVGIASMALFKLGDRQVRDARKRWKKEHKESSTNAAGFITPEEVFEEMTHDHIDLLADLESIERYFADYLEAITPESDNPYQLVASLSWSPHAHYPSLELVTTSPGRLIARYWRRYQSKAKPEDTKPSRLQAAILTSATLPNLPDVGLFDPIEEGKIKQGWQISPKLMIPSIWDTPLFAPQEFGDMSFVLSAPTVPVMVKNPIKGRYVNPEWESTHLFPMIDAMLQQAIKQFDLAIETGVDPRGVMILSPSGLDTDAILHHLQSTLPRDAQEKFSLINQTNLPLKMVVQHFRMVLKRRGRLPVLMTAGGWEGIDLPGSIAHLFVTRLPVPPIDEVFQDAMLQKHAPNYVRVAQRRMSEHAVQSKLCQGIGRLIRQSDDSGIVWLADPRFTPTRDVVDLARMHGIKDFFIKPTPEHLLRAIPQRFLDRLDEAHFFSQERGLHTLDDLISPATL